MLHEHDYITTNAFVGAGPRACPPSQFSTSTIISKGRCSQQQLGRYSVAILNEYDYIKSLGMVPSGGDIDFVAILNEYDYIKS